ncbi:TRAP transporter large permease [Cryobacterium sp. Y50]|uniref:TRAP transporter large permease n=1 Tax=Cryobacterium sp. Y50 TaxID=2048286 RepID=UPI0013049271|nr:TRAP transporter large permease [Cryobacterium sp. Y50]
MLAVVMLLVLMFLRVPVAICLLAAGVLGLILLDGPQVASASLARVPFQAIGKTTLIVIPMFILMGMFAKESGLAERLFAVIREKAARLPGGLAVATILACVGFGAVSGSSSAAVATVGKLSIGEMLKAGYNRSFASGTVASGGTLGILIPPSIALVIYGQVTEESIGSLLLAGIIPGILSAGVMILYILIRATVDKKSVGQGRGEPVAISASSSWGRIIGVTVRVLVLFGIVMGGIYTGFATPTEAAALGASAAFIMLLIDAPKTGRSRWVAFKASVRASVKLTAMIFALLIGASIFSTFLVRSGAPRDFAEWASSFDIAPILIVMIMLLLFVPLGMFVDGISMIVIAIPLTYPVVTELGFDGIWYGILAIKLIELGLITPPLGLNVFVTAGTTRGLKVEEIFRGVVPYYLVDVAIVAILIAFPVIVLWLPSVAG